MKSRELYFHLGRPFSPVYSLLMRVREHFFRKGYFATHRLSVPVISVGNLTMGGTGKTPVVQYIARLLHENGHAPAIISRGYGGASREPVNIVSDGSSVLLDPKSAGDEPFLLAKSLPGVPVLTGVVRKLPAQKAISMGADVLVLDDGFQHMQLARDIDLVLFNTDSLAGNSRVFPGGDLREPIKALARASDFLMTGVTPENRERAQRFAELLASKFSDIPTTFAEYAVAGYVQMTSEGNSHPTALAQLPSKKYLAMCGIAKPESFRRTLAGEGVEVVAMQALPDHAAYTLKQVAAVSAAVKRNGAEAILTTEKDLVKLSGATFSVPVYGLRMETRCSQPFDSRILGVVQR